MILETISKGIDSYFKSCGEMPSKISMNDFDVFNMYNSHRVCLGYRTLTKDDFDEMVSKNALLIFGLPIIIDSNIKLNKYFLN